jgi:hypothetical protein
MWRCRYQKIYFFPLNKNARNQLHANSSQSSRVSSIIRVSVWVSLDATRRCCIIFYLFTNYWLEVLIKNCNFSSLFACSYLIMFRKIGIAKLKSKQLIHRLISPLGFQSIGNVWNDCSEKKSFFTKILFWLTNWKQRKHLFWYFASKKVQNSNQFFLTIHWIVPTNNITRTFTWLFSIVFQVSFSIFLGFSNEIRNFSAIFL